MTRSIPFHKQTDVTKQPGQHVYGFDREPYLKHSNVAPDVTLSDYIARKQEEPKRITFDEWLDAFYPYSERIDGLKLGSYTLVSMFKECWNAALKQGKL